MMHLTRRVACRNSSTRHLATTTALQKTALYDLHLELGGKMVPFAGYELPVQYKGLGVLKEHLHTRSENCASLFDVSHMGQIRWYGGDAVAALEHFLVGDVDGMRVGESKLSLIVNDKCGIVDDTVITKCEDYIYMVVNGACKSKDIEHFQNNTKHTDILMQYDHTQQLLALQGDGAKAVIARLAPSVDLVNMDFMTSIDEVDIDGIACRLSRCGYTGEDGFEISVAEEDAVPLARTLLNQPEVKPAGLGARDSLRLEAGLCLYGNDLDEATNPLEGRLAWTIGPRRRRQQDFLGASHILNEAGKLRKMERARVGLLGVKGAAARENAEIYADDETTLVGKVTSGGFGPSLQKPVAMGYVEKAYSKDGTDLKVKVRDKMLPFQVSKMPFVPAKYYKAPK